MPLWHHSASVKSPDPVGPEFLGGPNPGEGSILGRGLAEANSCSSGLPRGTLKGRKEPVRGKSGRTFRTEATTLTKGTEDQRSHALFGVIVCGVKLVQGEQRVRVPYKWGLFTPC